MVKPLISISSPDGQISYDEYVEAVKDYNCAQGLAVIGQVSRALEFKEPIIEQSIFREFVPATVNQWQLAFLAKTLIERSNDFESKQLDDESIIGACDLYNQMRDPRIANPSVEEDDRDVFNFMVRTSYEQFPLQEGLYAHEIARAHILFEEIASAAASDEFNIDEAFRTLTGLTVREFMTIGLVHWSQAAKPIVTPIPDKIPKVSDIMVPEKQKQFVAMVATDYDTFRASQAKEEKRLGFEKFQFNCLQRFPLLRSQRFDRLLCPIPPFLLRRFTRGIYYYLLDAFNDGEKRNRFATFFGKNIFEPYVGQQLRHYLPPDRVFGEREISRSEKTCDWIVDLDDFVVLVECKTTGLTARAKAFADTEQITTDLKRRIVSGTQACERTRAAIAANRNGLGTFSGKPSTNLIVIYDEGYLFNGFPFQDIIEAELKKAGLDGISYQVSTIAELEYVLPALAKAGLGRFLDTKLRDPERRSQGLKTSVEKMVDKGELPELERNDLLQSKSRDIFDSMLPSGRSVTDHKYPIQ